TEDAYNASRADFIGLLCLRNPDATPTTVGVLPADQLDPQHLDQLFQPLYYFGTDLAKAGRPRMSGPEAVLSGAHRRRYLRVDPYFMSPSDKAAKEALAALSELIERGLEEVALGPGEMLFLDNHRAVHGRRPFAAKYDGSDRWLKRINISRDLRRFM